jgi:hypothetical protein
LIRTLSPLHRTLTFGIGYAVAVVVALCLTLMANSVAHAQTRAGTPIVNTAGLQYEAGGETHALDSNTVTLLVAERLDVRLVRDGQGAVAIDDGPTAVAFILTNADNGDEAFAVTADLAAGAAPTLAIDSDKNARYDPVHDAALVAGTTPALAPGETLRCSQSSPPAPPASRSSSRRARRLARARLAMHSTARAMAAATLSSARPVQPPASRCRYAAPVPTPS